MFALDQSDTRMPVNVDRVIALDSICTFEHPVTTIPSESIPNPLIAASQYRRNDSPASLAPLRSKRAFIRIVCCPLQAVERTSVQCILDLGRENEHFQFGARHRSLATAATNQTSIERGNPIKSRIPKLNGNRTRLSFQPSMRARFTTPIIWTSCCLRQPTLALVLGNREDVSDRPVYGGEILRRITELHERKVLVRAINGDNHPTLVSAIAHCPNRPQLKTRCGYLGHGCAVEWSEMPGKMVDDVRSATQLRRCQKANGILIV
jgi:hypothetical protein